MPIRFSVGTCCGCSCDAVIKVVDCIGDPITGVSVTVKASGSTVGSGTTDGSGLVTITLPNAGAYEVVLTGGGTRWGTFDDIVILACSGENTVTHVPATDYYCTLCCGLPLYKTLHWSASAGPLNGLSGVLNFNASHSQWEANDLFYPAPFGGVMLFGGDCLLGVCCSSTVTACGCVFPYDSLTCPASFEAIYDTPSLCDPTCTTAGWNTSVITITE